MWPVLQKDLLAHLPLRNVTWKSPLSGSFITIDRLPVVFRPADSAHFRDTTHPFAWYWGAYEYVYILVCESLDAYKSGDRQVWLTVPSRIFARRYFHSNFTSLADNSGLDRA